MTQNTILLFDIDGTLISTGGAGRSAFIEAFTVRTNARDAFDGFSFAGRTDRGIVKAGLRNAGLPADEALVDEVLDHYVDLLKDGVEASRDYIVHPGVHEAVEAVSKRGAAIGLGTGNIERGARIKLARADLNRWFDFGGFGCDAEERAELIRAGAERGAVSLGIPLDRCRVVVIGDTVRDVTAAHAIGGRCIAVGTGGIDRETFESAGTDLYFEHLDHEEARRTLQGIASGDIVLS